MHKSRPFQKIMALAGKIAGAFRNVATGGGPKGPAPRVESTYRSGSSSTKQRGAFGKSMYYRKTHGVKGRYRYMHRLPAYSWPGRKDRSEWLRKYRNLRKRGLLA